MYFGEILSFILLYPNNSLGCLNIGFKLFRFYFKSQSGILYSLVATLSSFLLIKCHGLALNSSINFLACDFPTMFTLVVIRSKICNSKIINTMNIYDVIYFYGFLLF